jgi:hypothetical protein
LTRSCRDTSLLTPRTLGSILSAGARVCTPNDDLDWLAGRQGGEPLEHVGVGLLPPVASGQPLPEMWWKGRPAHAYSREELSWFDRLNLATS